MPIGELRNHVGFSALRKGFLVYDDSFARSGFYYLIETRGDMPCREISKSAQFKTRC